MIISKELLKEVLNLEIDVLNVRQTKSYRLIIYETRAFTNDINVFELLHRCKRWASKKGFVLWSMQSEDESICRINQLDKKEFYASKEYEAVVKCCEWILEND